MFRQCDCTCWCLVHHLAWVLARVWTRATIHACVYTTETNWPALTHIHQCTHTHTLMSLGNRHLTVESQLAQSRMFLLQHHWAIVHASHWPHIPPSNWPMTIAPLNQEPVSMTSITWTSTGTTPPRLCGGTSCLALTTSTRPSRRGAGCWRQPRRQNERVLVDCGYIQQYLYRSIPNLCYIITLCILCS